MPLIQIPTDVPHPDNNTPVDLSSTFEVILYIVAPILLFIVYIYLRKKSRSTGSKDKMNNE